MVKVLAAAGVMLCVIVALLEVDDCLIVMEFFVPKLWRLCPSVLL